MKTSGLPVYPLTQSPPGPAPPAEPSGDPVVLSPVGRAVRCWNMRIDPANGEGHGQATVG